MIARVSRKQKSIEINPGDIIRTDSYFYLVAAVGKSETDTLYQLISLRGTGYYGTSGTLEYIRNKIKDMLGNYEVLSAVKFSLVIEEN